MRVIRIAALVTSFAFACRAQSGKPVAPDLLIADPEHYKLELENPWVRVIHETMPPHEGVKMHTHPDPGGVVVLLTNQNLRQETPDGTVKILTDGVPGRVTWATGRTHRGDNLMDTPYEYIEVEPKLQAALRPALPVSTLFPDPVVSDPQHYHVEFENDLVRVIRVRIGPLERIAPHLHPPHGAVLILLTDQDARQSFPDGTSHENHFKAHTVRWEPPGSGPHADRNLADRPLEIIRVELKHSWPRPLPKPE
jgi:quercetin dioxygenase-like cupin family protein